ncbi:MAG: hypothetical protein JJT99_11100 [Rhodobacteraceae bacterium]|nr:hypothetical protein [Paracoccaceae bacterium]
MARNIPAACGFGPAHGAGVRHSRDSLGLSRHGARRYGRMMQTRLRHISALMLACALALASVGFVQARHHAADAQTLVICSGYGLITITIDADGNPVEQTMPCPDCTLVLYAMLAEPAPVLARDIAARQIGATPPAAVWISAPAGFWAISRAPPALV